MKVHRNRTKNDVGKRANNRRGCAEDATRNKRGKCGMYMA